MRQTANIWRQLGLFLSLKKSDWSILKSPYLWQDSFMVHLNRLITCPFFGHGNVTLDENRFYCFKCQRIAFPTSKFKPGFYRVELGGYNLVDCRSSRITLNIIHIISNKNPDESKKGPQWEVVFTNPQRFKAMVNVAGKENRSFYVTRIQPKELPLYTWMNISSYGESLIKNLPNIKN